uniref:T. congolense-specific, cell surface-expressed gene family n=1 Tax=Trypanosoma congolense (strain IL3000) TaxID=1068625 RepID=G0V0P8_TRYCI|nr:hypothetical protein, unlikely [Trypanosoma congolense IL3000]
MKELVRPFCFLPFLFLSFLILENKNNKEKIFIYIKKWYVLCLSAVTSHQQGVAGAPSLASPFLRFLLPSLLQLRGIIPKEGGGTVVGTPQCGWPWKVRQARTTRRVT